MSDDVADSWDQEDFTPASLETKPQAAAQAAAVKKHVEEEEEEEEVNTNGEPTTADSKEAILAAYQKIKREFESYKKSVAAEKKKKAPKTLESLLTDEDRKKEEQRLIEEDDARHARSLFGEYDEGEATLAPSAASSKAAAPAKDPVAEIVDAVLIKFDKLKTHGSYFTHVERLVTGLTNAMDPTNALLLGDGIATAAKDRKKALQAAQDKKRQQAAKKPVEGGPKKVSGKFNAKAAIASALDDYYDEDYDDDHGDDDHGEDDGDFM